MNVLITILIIALLIGVYKLLTATDKNEELTPLCDGSIDFTITPSKNLEKGQYDDVFTLEFYDGESLARTLRIYSTRFNDVRMGISTSWEYQHVEKTKPYAVHPFPTSINLSLVIKEVEASLFSVDLFAIIDDSEISPIGLFGVMLSHADSHKLQINPGQVSISNNTIMPTISWP